MAAAAVEKKKSLWLAKKKFDLSRDFPHLCHATAPPPPPPTHCSVLIWLASGKLLYQLRLCFFHFFFYRISFTLPCGKVCRVTWRQRRRRRHSCVLQQQQPAAVSIARIGTGRVLGESCYWLTTNHFSSLVLPHSLWRNWIKIYIFNHLCSMRRCFNLSPSPFPSPSTSLSCHLFRCVSDSFARCQLIRCAFAFN